ncbi:hypothetical protein BJY00DRAFT_314757 [Aspergillus carlsbadensis]|nr:hypothetical protein BJY00DRAFT_314757 [Aspergillus carlsbadensis]
MKSFQDSDEKAREDEHALLKDVRQQAGCEFVATCMPFRGEFEWVLMQWSSESKRDEIMVSTTPGQRLTELLEQREAETNVILRNDNMTRLKRSNFRAPPRYYEIVTAYFPANLPPASQSSLRRIEGPLWLPRESGGDQVDEPKTPADGLVTQVSGYSRGQVEFQGSPAQRVYYFLCWEDQPSEELYKRELRHFLDRKYTAWEYFIRELEDCQMLGYEVESATLQEITPY